MNIVMIMSGGVGARFGAVIPKQYNLIAGKPVIDYVIDAVQESHSTDRIVIVMDPQWMDYSEKLKNLDADYAVNGETRLESVYNGMKLIRERYDCDKLVIVDAVAPFLYGRLIDDYFTLLNRYDAVITAQKITGGFTDIENHRLDRERYIITQSPEAFRFEKFWKHYDVHFPYQEMACMLPEDSPRYYNYEFRNNLKLTYDFELGYAAWMLQNLGRLNPVTGAAFFDRNLLVTEGIRSCLLRQQPEETTRWLDEVYAALPRLIAKWEITSLTPFQSSLYGLVLQAKSQSLGDVVVKFIPPFINRYERELEAFRILPSSYMCELIDVEESCDCMLLRRIIPARYASFEENLKLTEFFRMVIQDAVPEQEGQHTEHIPDYYGELLEKKHNIHTVPYLQDEVEAILTEAISLHERTFLNEPRYILHGDLHELNVLDDGQRFWGIDPGGMRGPVELECVRFIRNDMKRHLSFGLKERFDVLVRSFGRLVDEKRLVRIFLIDMAYCTFNSTFEYEEPDDALLDLQLIETAREWMKIHDPEAGKK